MKFAYVDESGDPGQGDVFVMAGLLIDAYRLPKYTARFDEMIKSFLEKHPGSPKELKTKVFINGSGGWSKIEASERKAFLVQVCDLASECANVFAIALSFQGLEKAYGAGHGHTFGKSYWVAAGMFLAAIIQKKMQKTKKNKGLTVFICDDNKKEMENFSDALYGGDQWFDPIYQVSKTKRGDTVWLDVPASARFDQIVNSAFAIKSHHSSRAGRRRGFVCVSPASRARYD
jgi:hypothetical protein